MRRKLKVKITKTLLGGTNPKQKSPFIIFVSVNLFFRFYVPPTPPPPPVCDSMSLICKSPHVCVSLSKLNICTTFRNPCCDFFSQVIPQLIILQKESLKKESSSPRIDDNQTPTDFNFLVPKLVIVRKFLASQAYLPINCSSLGQILAESEHWATSSQSRLVGGGRAYNGCIWLHGRGMGSGFDFHDIIYETYKVTFCWNSHDVSLRFKKNNWILPPFSQGGGRYLINFLTFPEYKRQNFLQYQPSGAGGTRSPPATPHRLQIQNDRQGAPKWRTGSGKVSTPRFLGILSNFP